MHNKMTKSIIFLSLILLFTSCQESNPLQPVKAESNIGTESELNILPDSTNSTIFPMYASKIFNYIDSLGYYEGGNIKCNGNKSKFNLDDGALTPPATSRKGNNITITMNVDYDQVNNELIFEFGPHGCQFSPAARVKLDYNPLGINIATLYYIDENGNYIEQTPDYININKKYMMINLDHFSRYAVAYGR